VVFDRCIVVFLTRGVCMEFAELAIDAIEFAGAVFLLGFCGSLGMVLSFCVIAKIFDLDGNESIGN
jgi:hypothetical protein